MKYKPNNNRENSTPWPSIEELESDLYEALSLLDEKAKEILREKYKDELDDISRSLDPEKILQDAEELLNSSGNSKGYNDRSS